LEAPDADILCIFDCCNAGGLLRHRGPARFEYLGACGTTETTPAKGPNTFTSALIWALEGFLTQKNTSFNTPQLQARIWKYPTFPRDQHPTLGHHYNFPSRDHIVISPQLKNDEHQQPVSIHHTKAMRGKNNSSGECKLTLVKGPYDIVDIRYHFDGKLSEDAFMVFAKGIRASEASVEHLVPVRRIQFIAKRSSLSLGGFLFTRNQAGFAANLFTRMIQRRGLYMWIAKLKRFPKCKVKWKSIESRSRPLQYWLKEYKPPLMSTSSDLIAQFLEEVEPERVGSAHLQPRKASKIGIQEPRESLNTPDPTDDQRSNASIVTKGKDTPSPPPAASLGGVKRKRKSGPGAKSPRSRKTNRRAGSS
jgi:hypothetical protein